MLTVIIVVVDNAGAAVVVSERSGEWYIRDIDDNVCDGE